MWYDFFSSVSRYCHPLALLQQNYTCISLSDFIVEIITTEVALLGGFIPTCIITPILIDPIIYVFVIDMISAFYG
jgi:hypothetical protein